MILSGWRWLNKIEEVRNEKNKPQSSQRDRSKKLKGKSKNPQKNYILL
jgi:hypothetical protein